MKSRVIRIYLKKLFPRFLMWKNEKVMKSWDYVETDVGQKMEPCQTY